MSSSQTSDSSPTSPSAASNTKQTSSEPANNDSSGDGRDLLHSLKGQVSFAKQCLGLLQNQMKHAMDTLEILQDQVIKAQSTIDRIERKGSKQTDQRAVSESPASEDSPAHIHGHRMLVVDSSGQPLYAIDKSAAASYGVPVQHQGGVCNCASCVNVSLGHPVFISEQNQQLIAVHPGQTVYHIDGKPVASPSSHESIDKRDEHQVEHITQNKKRKLSISDSEDEQGPSHNESSKGQGDGKSSSPITSQLLQVLDVLQNAGDEDRKESTSSARSLRSSTSMPFTGPVPLTPEHTASGTGILSVGRRCRKQEMKPTFRREESGLTHLLKIERDLPELMKVPPPVLAATLEPDFLVVPGNSYFSESPPSSAGGGPRERHDSNERRLSESRMFSSSEVKKEQIENVVEARRSSSTSTISQNSETSSRSPSESSERYTIDSLKRSDATNEVVSHINKISDNDSTAHARNQRVDDNTVSIAKSHANGESHRIVTAVTSGESKIPHPVRQTQRISLLNSTNQDSLLEPTSPSQLSPRKSPVRLIKVSPLNSAVTGATSSTEARRPSLDYTSNHGIVRISSATSMTASNSKHVALEPSAFSNNIHKASIHTYVNSSDTEPDLPIVTTAYSVAQISNDDRKCTSPSKRPNILSRNRIQQNKKDIPQGIVVLVPTIEDAKQLIKSSGGNQGNTPVLVPQKVLNQINSNGEASKSAAETHVPTSYVGKRSHYTDASMFKA